MIDIKEKKKQLKKYRVHLHNLTGNSHTKNQIKGYKKGKKIEVKKKE